MPLIQPVEIQVGHGPQGTESFSHRFDDIESSIGLEMINFNKSNPPPLLIDGLPFDWS